MKIKTIMISVAVLLLLVAGMLLGGQAMSLTSGVGTDNVVKDTGIGCQINNDCKTNSQLPSNSYCEDSSCKFVDTEDLIFVYGK